MKTAVATIAVGNHQQLHQLTEPRMQEYAASIGAQYFCMRGSFHRLPHFAKFELFGKLLDRGFDRVLYVDADVYIRQTAPNIFDTYDSAAASELPHPVPEHVTRATNWIRQRLDPNWPCDRYFNTGVLVIGHTELQAMAWICRQAKPLPGVYFEQEQLNVLMRDVGFPRQTLTAEWNCFCKPEWYDRHNPAVSYFLHANVADPVMKNELLTTLIQAHP